MTFDLFRTLCSSLVTSENGLWFKLGTTLFLVSCSQCNFARHNVSFSGD